MNANDAHNVPLNVPNDAPTGGTSTVAARVAVARVAHVTNPATSPIFTPYN
jgi:hypothetical protein